GIRLDVVSVMAATMLASIDTILEALGGSASESVAVEGGDHQMVATKIGSKAFLVVIARKSVARSAVRKTVRELVTQLSKIASEILPDRRRDHGGPQTSGPSTDLRPPRPIAGGPFPVRRALAGHRDRHGALSPCRARARRARLQGGYERTRTVLREGGRGRRE